MDPITIWLSRYRNYPVQVFTGYLDRSPYLQLYPGTVTLHASCTLKRLLHTYWDPALRFSRDFLAQYNWIQDSQTGQMQNLAAQMGQLGPNGHLTDGSIGQVLYAVLTEKRLGNWGEHEVFVEQLPANLVSFVKKLYDRFAGDQAELEKQLTTLLSSIIGGGSYGKGGTGQGASPSGEIQGIDKIVPAMAAASNKHGVPPEFTVAVYLIEWGHNNNRDDPGNPHYGYFQQQLKDAPYRYGTMSTKPPTLAETHDLNIATEGFVTAAAGWANADPSLKGNFYRWAITVQGVIGNLASQSKEYQYQSAFDAVVAEAKTLLTRYKAPLDPNAALPTDLIGVPGAQSPLLNPPRQGGSGGKKYDAIIAEANRLDKVQPPYSGARPPSDKGGYDCSSSCASILRAAGVNVPFFNTANAPQYMKPGQDPSGRLTFWNNDASGTAGIGNGTHIFATIGGRDWGTSGEHPNGGPGWTTVHDKTSFRPYHIEASVLDSTADKPIPLGADTTVPGGGDASGGAPGNVLDSGIAAAFVTQVAWPSIEQQTEAIALQGQKSLMNDQQLMPFVQQLVSASLRQFQSLPNGDFFAFFPDYFGDFNHRKPYWHIEDIEILDGKIELTDDSLATHVYTVGDTVGKFDGVNFVDKILSGGVVTIFNAFESEFVKGGFDAKGQRSKLLASKADAIKFLQKYGARPYYEEVPQIRSPYYEAFYAFQTFQLLWSRTFLTEFRFTFMPEVYPGGLVAFPHHDLQCYVDSVSHDFDYEAGFTTTAQLSAPAAYGAIDHSGVSSGLVRANWTP